MEEIKITKIEIQIGKNTFSLTVEEAKQLKKVLCEAFENQQPTVIYPYVLPYYQPIAPLDDYQTTWTDGMPPDPYGLTTCG